MKNTAGAGKAFLLSMTVAAAVWATGAGAEVNAPAFGFEPAGTKIKVRLSDLPEPYSGPSRVNLAVTVEPPPDFRPSAPSGFRVNLFAEGLDHPRNLLTAPDGGVYVAHSHPGTVSVLYDHDGDGRADAPPLVCARGFDIPYGLAFADGALFVADRDHIWRVSGLPCPSASKTPLTPSGALGGGSGHRTRNLALHPEDGRFFVAIGSRGNIGEEPVPRATIQEFTPDGSTRRSFAAGLRNAVGLSFRPGSTELWTVVNERDTLGDALVPDYLAQVEEGAFYGWPYAYLGGVAQPGFAERRPDLVAATRAPEVLFRAHSAPLGLVFYDGLSFPPAYKGDAFVALHGSWNAGRPRGYLVARVPFKDGKPLGHYEVFATGWRRPDGNAPGEAQRRALSASGGERVRAARVAGRPCAVTVAADGSLLIADDVTGSIWRVQWVGERR